MKKQKTTKEIKEAIKNYKNISYDHKTKLFTVRYPTGKEKTFKTMKATISQAEKAQEKYIIPKIITQNTYFWKSRGNAHDRRKSEERRNYEILIFSSHVSKLPGINVDGKYEESCKNVYKHMYYNVNGEKTNITGIINAAAKYGLILIKQ